MMFGMDREGDEYKITSFKFGRSIGPLIKSVIIFTATAFILKEVISSGYWYLLIIPLILLIFGSIYFIDAVGFFSFTRIILDNDGIWKSELKRLKLLCTWDEIISIGPSPSDPFAMRRSRDKGIEILTSRIKTSKTTVFQEEPTRSRYNTTGSENRVRIFFSTREFCREDLVSLYDKIREYRNIHGLCGGIVDTRPAAYQVPKVDRY